MPVKNSFYQKHGNTLKKYFIPHSGNNFHPHILHTKRAIFYSAFFILIKVMVVGAALAVPLEAFLAPDVLAEQGKKIVAMTNELRKEKGLASVTEIADLDSSAQMRATDMASQQYFSHTSPDGKKLQYFLGQAGYHYSEAGENLAMGFSDAESVMSGWMKSPTHYANLAESIYTDVGVGIAGGIFNGTPTVFVAQHFGTPIETKNMAMIRGQESAEVLRAIKSAEQRIANSEQLKSSGKVLAEKTINKTPQPATRSSQLVARSSKPETRDVGRGTSDDVSSPVLDAQKSSVAWSDTADGRTHLVVKAAISKDAIGALAMVQGYQIELGKNQDGMFEGSLTVPASSKEIFQTVMAPTVMIAGENGTMSEETIDWQNPKVISQTPWQKYMQAKSWLYSSIPVFMFSNWVYFFFLLFFCIALAINILVEIRQQHKHVILQTVGLIALLVCLLKF
ncbi:MAG: CAP domain-containing protein [Patescibacteria group bacterium]